MKQSYVLFIIWLIVVVAIIPLQYFMVSIFLLFLLLAYVSKSAKKGKPLKYICKIRDTCPFKDRGNCENCAQYVLNPEWKENEK